MSGAIVWFTGLPASGKTTLARRLRDRLAEAGQDSVLLDSDEVRARMAPELGYGRSDRDHFYARLAATAVALAREGRIVLVAATAPRRAHREAARAAAPRFLEVFVDVPVSECAARDPKGLYAAFLAGSAPDLPRPGEYEPPSAPDLVARGGHDEEALRHLVRALQPVR